MRVVVLAPKDSRIVVLIPEELQGPFIRIGERFIAESGVVYRPSGERGTHSKLILIMGYCGREGSELIRKELLEMIIWENTDANLKKDIDLALDDYNKFCLECENLSGWITEY